MLELKSLSKRYGSKPGVWAIEDVTFGLAAGEIVGLVGSNGAGKTTTMSIVAGLIGETGGEVLCQGSVLPVRAPRAWLGAWVGEPGFYGHLTGADHLRATAGLKGINLSRAEAERRLAAVGLVADDSRRRVGRYSTGMRQRLAYATAVVGDPEVVMLDEPTSGLDPEGIRLILDDLVARAKNGAAVLLSSHRLAEIETVADRIVMLARGRSIEVDKAERRQVSRIRCEDPVQAEVVLARNVKVVRLGRNVVVDGGVETHASILALLEGAGIEVLSIDSDSPTLEEIFLLHLVEPVSE